MKRLNGFIIVFTMVLALLGSSGVAVSGEKASMKEMRVAAIEVGSWEIPGSLAFHSIDKEESTPLMAVLSPQDYYGP